MNRHDSDNLIASVITIVILILIAGWTVGCATPAAELRTKFDECHANGFDAVVVTNWWTPGRYRFAGCKPHNAVLITGDEW